MAFIGLGWWADNRERIRFGSVQLVALVVSAAILGALLGSWWLDTKDAIALMCATVYPGGRGAMPGGDLGWCGICVAITAWSRFVLRDWTATHRKLAHMSSCRC